MKTGMRKFLAKISIGLFGLSLLTAASLNAHARQEVARADTAILHGIVLDLRNDQPMANVQVRNLNAKSNVETTNEGRFSIAARKNDLLEFRYNGYRTDTLLLIEHEFKRIYLSVADGNILIDAVTVRALTNSQLDLEIEKAEKEGQFLETSIHRGGIRLSPSRLFGESGRRAREHYEMLLKEKDRRAIDRRFSRSAVQAVTPLKGDELEMFLVRFRPGLDFVLKSSEQDFNLYIMDSYAKFKALSPEEKKAIQWPGKGT